MLLRSFSCFPSHNRFNLDDIVGLRSQFLEQAKCLDSELDVKSTILAELQEFYRRRALVEQDYSDSLAKLANTLKNKHINESTKRSNLTNYTTTTIWSTLLGSTLRLSEAHCTLADVYGKQMVQRFADIDEDAIRLHRQCREMMNVCQTKVLTNTAKLQSDQREYGQRQHAQVIAERAVRRSEEKFTAAIQHADSKKKEPEKSQRCCRAKADFEQKNSVYDSRIVETNQARNVYLIQLSAANESINHYFTDEISDIIDCMNCGFHNCLARTAMMHISCEEAMNNCHTSIGEMINRNITALDWRHDKALFLRRNEQSFARPSAFTFVPYQDDNIAQLSTISSLKDSLVATAHDLKLNLASLKKSTEETWTSLQEIEKRLLLLINQNDYDVSELFALGKDQRARTGSLSNGLSNSSIPSSPLSVTSSSSNTNPNAGIAGPPISSSIPSGINKVDVAGNPLSKHSVTVGDNNASGIEISQTSNSSNQLIGEIQPGLYLSLRLAYREKRIKEEKLYMEKFSAYTQEMHRYYVMQAKLIEIEKALSQCAPHEKTSLVSDPVAPPPPVHRFPSVSVPVVVPAVSDKTVFTQIAQCSLQAASAPVFGFTERNNSHTYKSGTVSLSPLPSPPSIPVDTVTVESNSLLKPAPRRVLRVPNIGRAKLFGGSIDEFVEDSKEAIPRIVLSCIRLINLFGMHHQGIFRVSGSQAEINTFRASFENGEDPLVGLSDARYINSIAGLLKLYFRELGDPPFSHPVYMKLISVVKEFRETKEISQRLRETVSQGLSTAVFVVMRYLFAFLHHLTEYSDENMMDPFNLAICFGPSLMPIPAELDQVEYQVNVNEVVKNMIQHHLVIFDQNVRGPRYEKYNLVSQALIAKLAMEEHQHRRRVHSSLPFSPTSPPDESATDLSREIKKVTSNRFTHLTTHLEADREESVLDGLNSTEDHHSMDGEIDESEALQSDSESEAIA